MKNSQTLDFSELYKARVLAEKHGSGTADGQQLTHSSISR